MKHHFTDINQLQFAISPQTVYISTNPDQNSYADIIISLTNGSGKPVAVSGIAVTLPAELAPANSITSIIPAVSPQNLCNFTRSQINVGEFDATPQSGDKVVINPNDVWLFKLEKVTLVNTIIQPAADVIITVTLSDGSAHTEPLPINIALAVASITSFKADPSNIGLGDTATLSWACEKINYCILDPADSAKNEFINLPATGSCQVSPAETTVYTLYAYGDGLILSAQYAVSVDSPRIVEFGGPNGDTGVDYGHGIVLIWVCNQFTKSIAITNADGVNIPDNLLSGGNTPQSGSITLEPTLITPTTFTLTAFGTSKHNYATLPATITINDVTATFTASPADGLWESDQVTLNWAIKSPATVDFSPWMPNGPSAQNLSGSIDIYPGENISYQLTVTGLESNKPASITVPVNLTVAQVALNSFTITPELIDPNNGPNQATLAWDTQAQLVTIDNGIGVVNPKGSYLLNTPADYTSYKLNAGTVQYPGMYTETVMVNNIYGPFIFNRFDNQSQRVIFYLTNPDQLNKISALYTANTDYYVSLTGVKTDQSEDFALIAELLLEEDEPAIAISYTVDLLYIVFEWIDPNSRTGTIMLSSLYNRS